MTKPTIWILGTGLDFELLLKIQTKAAQIIQKLDPFVQCFNRQVFGIQIVASMPNIHQPDTLLPFKHQTSLVFLSQFYSNSSFKLFLRTSVNGD